jgi:hypothetical protein
MGLVSNSLGQWPLINPDGGGLSSRVKRLTGDIPGVVSVEAANALLKHARKDRDRRDGT